MVNYQRRIIITLFAFATIGGIGWWLQEGDVVPSSDTNPKVSPHAVATPPVAPQVPAAATSPYLNTTSDVAYISTTGCAKCHVDTAESYQQTAHGLALAPIDSASHPPATKFFNAAQGKMLQVLHERNATRHRDWAIVDDQQPVDAAEKTALNDYPIEYAIGSGHNALSFLAKVDGFLVESPATWYAEKQKWDLSPGYELGDYNGFARGVDILCLRCHSGRFEVIDESPQRIKFHELSIGCENCHGPGSLHADRHTADRVDSDAPDLTIVNPSKLPRALNEAICAQCHLATGADAYVRGPQRR